MPKLRFTPPVAAAALSLLLAACAPPAPPPPPPAPPPPAPTVPGPQSISERSVLTLAADLAFGKGSYTLTKPGKTKLAALVPTLKAAMTPETKIVVYGYTDNTPVAKALVAKGITDNLDLSSKRANEAVRFLISKGIDPNVISAKGRGETHPVAPNDTLKGRAQNRRIEVVVEQPSG